MFELTDQKARNAFTSELAENFSVIAGAGAGKTTAIVERIVALALQDKNSEDAVLPRLVVVTYTRKAAEEMEQRVRNELMRRPGCSGCLGAVNRVFFGTIHSFCLELLYKFGSLVGIPATLTLVNQEDILWLEFVRNLGSLNDFIPDPFKKEGSQVLDVSKILEAGKDLSPRGFQKRFSFNSPHIEWARLLNFEADKRNFNSIEEGKALLEGWLQAFEAGEPSLGIPSYDKGGAAFRACWAEVVKPLQDWAGKLAFAFAANVAEAYAQFRLSRGLVSYDDMVRLALNLLKEPKARAEIYKQRYCVILDEAQDTDEDQFSLLLEITRPSTAKNFWLKEKKDPPEKGRFCMVGDPQQSIYGRRADVATYLEYHRTLIESSVAQELKFCVTMRCDEAIVDAVDTVFPKLFSKNSPIHFMPLQKRPEAEKGQVLKYTLPPMGPLDKSKELFEAQRLAQWLKKESLSSLGLDDWSELVFLAPRKKWLLPLAQALEEVGFNAQIHSQELSQGDNPAYAWLTGLITLIAEPCNAFELAGVLREVFGVSDHDMAYFVNERGITHESEHPLQILTETTGEGPLVEALNLLYETRQTVLRLPWVEAVRVLVNKISLSQRLSFLPDYPEGTLSQTLELLLLKAVEGEITNFREWADVLQEGYYQLQEDTPVKTGFIQLYTCHKSKGLEWKLVIVPFLFKGISQPPVRYPKLLEAKGPQPPILLLDGTHKHLEYESYRSKKDYEEYKRLLYVTLTRARQRLILVDDASLFENEKEKSLAYYLKITSGAENFYFWEGLPRKLHPLGISFKKEESSVDLTWLMDVQPKCDNAHLALTQIKQFPQRIIPSSLAHEDACIAQGPTSQLQKGGTDYGNWWHLMMEDNPWGQPIRAWRSHCFSALKECPDPQRGEQEIMQFLASEIAKHLALDSVVVHTEVPFMWPTDQNIIYEGSIDLVAWDPASQSVRVLDWKTDLLGSEGIAGLVATYKPQINIYRKTTEALLGKPCQAWLYATRAGIAQCLEL